MIEMAVIWEGVMLKYIGIGFVLALLYYLFTAKKEDRPQKFIEHDTYDFLYLKGEIFLHVFYDKPVLKGISKGSAWRPPP